MPEELKNMTVQLDSKTAEDIANKYITYKYVDTFCGFFCVVLTLVLIALGIRKWIISESRL